MWLFGIFMFIMELPRVSKRSIKDQICFIFLTNLPIILYFNLTYLAETGKYTIKWGIMNDKSLAGPYVVDNTIKLVYDFDMLSTAASTTWVYYE